MSWLQEITERFPIRKKDEQKKQFLAYAVERAQKMGYAARVEENGRGGQHKNFVAGDPDQARVIFTAHYDTPAVMFLPNLMLPRNIPLFILYQILVVGALIAVGLAAAFAAFALTKSRQMIFITFLVVYYALLLVMIAGPANQHNVNDNTSGVAAVLRLMETLPPECRAQAAFLLFDNEEKGMRGSKAFALQHERVKKDILVVNLDCVGVGEHMLVIAKNYARAMGEYALLEQSLAPAGDIVPHFYGTTGSVMNSDQKSFRRGVAVAACKRKKIVGYYTPSIHTRRDTVAREENIEYLARSLSAFVKTLAEN